MEKIGSFLGGKLIDAAAVAAAVGLLRTGGVRDPKTLAGAMLRQKENFNYMVNWLVEN